MSVYDETGDGTLIREMREGARRAIEEAGRSPRVVKILCRMILEDCNVLLDRMVRREEGHEV